MRCSRSPQKSARRWRNDGSHLHQCRRGLHLDGPRPRSRGAAHRRSDAPGDAAGREIALWRQPWSNTAHPKSSALTTRKKATRSVAARRAAFPALERLGNLLLEDVGVPLPALPALVRGVEKLAAEHEITIALVAHAGDGNTHPLIVYDGADPASTARAQTAFGRIMDLAIELGGTITGEHGVGRSKKAWLPAYLGDDVMALTRRIKDALDPGGILTQARSSTPRTRRMPERQALQRFPALRGLI